MSKAGQDRKRASRHKEQGGVCYYCLDPIGHEIGGLGDPHLDHYTPRCYGGRRLVLSCGFCGHVKGMMAGAEFEAIVKKHFNTASSKNIARQRIVAECKPINIKLQEAHPPNIIGKKQCAERAKAWIAKHNVSIIDKEKVQEWHTQKLAEKYPALAVIYGAVPHPDDRHWESWTGPQPL